MSKLGIFVNIGAVAWLLMVWVFCFFPVSIPVTPQTMNWNVVMFVGISVIGLVYWFIWGRKAYRPPVFLVCARRVSLSRKRTVGNPRSDGFLDHSRSTLWAHKGAKGQPPGVINDFIYQTRAARLLNLKILTLDEIPGIRSFQTSLSACQVSLILPLEKVDLGRRLTT
jgi:hypothetical protein